MSLRTQREKCGLTQAEVAERCNIARSTYTNIETGAKQPSVSLAKRIGSILGMPWSNIFDEDNDDDASGNTLER